jgi:hypothetical protein
MASGSEPESEHRPPPQGESTCLFSIPEAAFHFRKIRFLPYIIIIALAHKKLIINTSIGS